MFVHTQEVSLPFSEILMNDHYSQYLITSVEPKNLQGLFKFFTGHYFSVVMSTYLNDLITKIITIYCKWKWRYQFPFSASLDKQMFCWSFFLITCGSSAKQKKALPGNLIYKVSDHFTENKQNVRVLQHMNSESLSYSKVKLVFCMIL